MAAPDRRAALRADSPRTTFSRGAAPPGRTREPILVTESHSSDIFVVYVCIVAESAWLNPDKMSIVYLWDRMAGLMGWVLGRWVGRIAVTLREGRWFGRAAGRERQAERSRY